MSVISIDGSSLGNALTQLLCAEDISPGEFYVYVLFRPDGRPCYVGKGRGNRWLHHERNPRRWARESERDILRNYHAMMTPEQRAQRSLTIKLATIEAMKDPHIRAKISESRRR